ncbi:MAG: extracellular solute-binding protein [Burkholderiaceae bacterium]|nr:extracellular solute-binding protein [Burkholderiaceae bacterium]
MIASSVARLLLLGTLVSFEALAQPTVLYTSTDQEYAEVVLKEAQAALGREITAVFDAEASKTVGLERRLVAEKARPRADVFWNSEMLRTHRLDKQGVLGPTAVDKSLALPAAAVTAHSVGFGVRSRVIAVHTPSVPEAARPTRLQDLADPRFKGKVAIARPLFGTTSTHFAALHAQLGAARFSEFLQALKRNEVMILPGNGDVRDAVAAGRAAVGLTDTDDAIGAIRRGQPLAMVFPDQDGEGAFSVHMTVARVAGGPNPAGAQQLVEYLASEKTEARLIELGAVQIPVRPHLPMAREIGPVRPKLWLMDPARIDASLEPSVELIRKHLL